MKFRVSIGPFMHAGFEIFDLVGSRDLGSGLLTSRPRGAGKNGRPARGCGVERGGGVEWEGSGDEDRGAKRPMWMR